MKKEEKRKKNHSHASKKSKAQINSESSFVCPSCGQLYSEDEDELWICCDKCDQWYDLKCTGLKSKARVPKLFYCLPCS